MAYAHVNGQKAYLKNLLKTQQIEAVNIGRVVAR